MYRAPEMVDLYSNMPVTEKVDIWVSFKGINCSMPQFQQKIYFEGLPFDFRFWTLPDS